MGTHGVVKRRGSRWLFTFILILIAYLWSCVTLTYAQGAPHRTTKKDFLWSVKTEKTTLYLLGSLHLLKSDSYPLDRKIENAYKDCTRIVFETDIDGAKSPAMQEKMLATGFYPEGQTLKQSISKQTYALLEKKAITAGLTMDKLDRLKPWSCALLLEILELKRLGFDPQYGIDAYFFHKAQQDGKELVFLETVEYQLRLFTELSEQEGESLLSQTLEELDVVETMLPTIVKAWEQGDVATLDSYFTKTFKDHPDIYRRFVVQRNREWISKIEDLIKQGGTTMVIMGAGHLVGSESILQLLKDRGYGIEQISAGGEASSESLAHALYIKSGMERQIRELPLAIQAGLEMQRIQDASLQQVPQDVYDRIMDRLAKAYVADDINEIILKNIDSQMSHDEMQRIFDWHTLPLGTKYANLATVHMTPKTMEEMGEFMKGIQQSPPPSTRMAFIQELAHATKTVEIAVEIGVHTRLIMATVHAATSQSTQLKQFSKILEESDTQRAKLEPLVSQQAISSMLYFYRSLTDAELKGVIAFAKSDIGSKYYRIVANGIKEGLLYSSIHFGSSMEDMSWRRKRGL